MKKRRAVAAQAERPASVPPLKRKVGYGELELEEEGPRKVAIVDKASQEKAKTPMRLEREGDSQAMPVDK